jgi:hypothetical protein
MKFRVEEVNGRPLAVFEDEKPPRSWLLTSFLEEARVAVEDFLSKIESVQSGKLDSAGCTGDGVEVEFYSDRAVIEELYPAAGEDAEPERIEIPLEQARQILLDWQVALEQWRPHDNAIASS